MKRIILHIGTPKTGTTALQQNFFKLNLSSLEENGVGYYVPSKKYVPWGGYSNGDFLVYDTLIKCENQDHSALQEAMQINTADHYYMLDTYINKARKNIDAEMQRFKAYAKDLDTIILSEEVFYHSEVFFPAFWPIIQKTLFDLFGKDIQIDIVLYLRRQDLWIESKFKEGTTTIHPWKLSIDETIQEYKRIGFLNYYATLQRLESTFGKEHVLVRNYQRSSLVKNDIIYDFWDACKLSWDSKYQYNKDSFNKCSILSKLSWDSKYQYNKDSVANHSLNAYATYALDFINRNIPVTDIQKSVLYKISKQYTYQHPDEKNCTIISPKQRQEILDFCQECNQKISKEYSNGEPFFDNTIKETVYIAPDTNRDKKLAKQFLTQTKRNYPLFFLKKQIKRFLHYLKGC